MVLFWAVAGGVFMKISDIIKNIIERVFKSLIFSRAG